MAAGVIFLLSLAFVVGQIVRGHGTAKGGSFALALALLLGSGIVMAASQL